jgi:hypothetical protein
MQLLTRFLRRNEVDPKLEKKIKQYLDFLFDHEREMKNEETALINSLSVTLREDLYKSINGKIIKSNQLFSKSFGSTFLSHLAMKVEEHVLAPDEIIFQVLLFI